MKWAASTLIGPTNVAIEALKTDHANIMIGNSLFLEKDNYKEFGNSQIDNPKEWKTDMISLSLASLK